MVGWTDSRAPQHPHAMQDFRPLLESVFLQERKSPAGRKRIDVIVRFKVLVLQ